MDKAVTAKNYTLRTENGGWLGQIVLTSDGAFMALTDWGSFNFAWRASALGDRDFREFILGLSFDYFAGKMYQGMTYVVSGKKIQEACNRFAEHILPALQKELQKELDAEKSAPKNKKSDLVVMQEMASQNMDIRSSTEFIEAKNVRGGTSIAMGVEKEIGQIIMRQFSTGDWEKYVIMYVIDKKQFDKLKNE